MIRQVSELVRNADLPTLPPGATVREACEHMRDRRVGYVLVTDRREKLLGVFTERDAVCRMLVQSVSADQVTLTEVMTKNPATVPSWASALEALRLMQDGGLRHVPVVAGDRVVGVISHADFRPTEHAQLARETELFEILR